jgi:hypothetical protein
MCCERITKVHVKIFNQKFTLLASGGIEVPGHQKNQETGVDFLTGIHRQPVSLIAIGPNEHTRGSSLP